MGLWPMQSDRTGRRPVSPENCLMKARRTWLLLLLVLPLSAHADPLLKQGDFVAICGDSITEQKQYSVFIEDYLLMCRPDLKTRAMQFGWGGEVSWGFLGRMDNDALRYKPHPTHFSVEEAIAAAGRIGAERTYFTHVCHDLGHAETCTRLPPGVELAYDGQILEIAD